MFNTIYSWIEGKGKNVTKNVTLVTILTTFFHVILETEHSKVVKLGMMQEKH